MHTFKQVSQYSDLLSRAISACGQFRVPVQEVSFLGIEPAILFKMDILGQDGNFINQINQAFFNILDIPLESLKVPKFFSLKLMIFLNFSIKLKSY